jgi:hypothetical protein
VAAKPSLTILLGQSPPLSFFMHLFLTLFMPLLEAYMQK